MTDFDDLLDRATRRLSADPELQLEVRRELRTHLAESTAEHAAAGSPDPDAAAADALGDADALADQLYAANHRRLRVRRAVRWTAGLSAVPALAAVAVAVAWGPAMTLGLMMSMAAGWMASYPVLRAGPVPSLLTEHVQKRFEAGLSPEARRWVTRTAFPDPHWPDRAAVTLAACRAWADADPRDPAARATYALHLVNSQFQDRNGNRLPPSPSSAELLAVLAADERAEPDNGLYPLLRSQVLFGDSIRYGVHFGNDLNGGFVSGPWQFRIEEIHVTDPARFAAGLAALHDAATRPRYATHQGEIAAALARAIPPSGSPADLAIRQELIQQPDWGPPFDSIATSWAAGLAQAGDFGPAAALVPDLRALARLLARADDGPRAVVNAGGFSTDADGLAAIVARQQKRPADFDRLVAHGVTTERDLDAVYRTTGFGIDDRAEALMTMQVAVAGWIALLCWRRPGQPRSSG